jgi:hypothetical protein
LGGFGSGVTAFGEDLAGNMYFSELGGALYKVCEIGAEVGCGPEPPAPKPAREPTLTLIDEFTTSHNYQGGTVPNGGIWTGVHNPGFGDTFNANTSNAGNLTIGMEPVGWQGGGEDNAPFLHREVNADNLMEVRVRIQSQVAGNWSSAGILVRADGPLDNNAENDNFLSAHAFRANNNVQVSNVTAGSEAEGNFGAGSAAALAYLRLVSLGDGEFEVFSSEDGVDWISRTTVTNAALATGNLEVGVWAGCYPAANATCTNGTTRFEWAEIVLGVPAGDYNEDGFIDAADYVVWRDTVGQPVAAWDGADGTGDGMVDDFDYQVWMRNFGKTIPNFSGSGSSAFVPEPYAGALLLIPLLGALSARRRRGGPAGRSGL